MGTLTNADTAPSQTWEILLVSGVGVAAGSLMVLSSGDYLQFVVMSIALAPVLMVSFRWPAVFLYLVTLSSALAGAQRSLSTVDIHDAELSVSGLRWVVVAAFVSIVIIANLRRLPTVPHLVPFVAFAFVAVARFAVSFITGRERGGLSDVLFYTLPVLFTWFVLLAVRGSGDNVGMSIRLALAHGVTFLWMAYLVLIPMGLVEFGTGGPDGVIRPRPVGQFGLIALIVALATWRYGASPAERRRGALFSGLSMALVVFTMSRTVGFVAFLFLIGHRLDPKRIRQFIAIAMVAVLGFGLLVYSVPLLRARFFFDPEIGIDETVNALRTAGRNTIWPVVMEHAVESPIVGWGLGSARLEAARVFASRDVERFHPHNEFLQVFHDMGAIGLVALVAGLAAIGLFHLRAWRRADSENNRGVALWNMAAFLGLWAVLLSSVTGNTLHYPFTMVPLFAIMALAFHVAARRESGDRTPAPSPKTRIPPG